MTSFSVTLPTISKQGKFLYPWIQLFGSLAGALCLLKLNFFAFNSHVLPSRTQSVVFPFFKCFAKRLPFCWGILRTKKSWSQRRKLSLILLQLNRGMWGNAQFKHWQNKTLLLHVPSLCSESSSKYVSNGMLWLLQYPAKTLSIYSSSISLLA